MLVLPVCLKDRSALVLHILQSSALLSDLMQHSDVLIMELPESCLNTRVREIVMSKPGASTGQCSVGPVTRPFPPMTAQAPHWL